MSLTKDDLTDIRGVVTEVIIDALNEVVNPRFDRIEARLDEHSATLAEHSTTLAEHGKLLTGHGRRLTAIEDKLDDILGRLEAVEADIKELHALLDAGSPFDKKFATLPPEQQVRKMHTAFLALAERLHVEL